MTLKQKIVRRYEAMRKYYLATGLKISFPLFVLLMFVLAITASFTAFALIQFLPPKLQQSTGLLMGAIFFAVISMTFGIPMTLRNNRIDVIDSSLPDALKHMALVLKAGGTTESALEEVANSEYGPISEELKTSLKQLREGKPFDDVLRDTAEVTGSRLFMRTAGIIIDARRAGAGLAEVMNAIAEDARDVLRIGRERKARTVMHVAFLVISGLLLSPFIFGFTMSIVEYMSVGIATSGGFGQTSLSNNLTLSQCNVPCLAAEDSAMATFLSFGFVSPSDQKPLYEWRLAAMDQLLLTFLAIQSVITLLALGLIRDGRIIKYVVYFPFAFVAIMVIYIIGKLFSTFIINS